MGTMLRIQLAGGDSPAGRPAAADPDLAALSRPPLTWEEHFGWCAARRRVERRLGRRLTAAELGLEDDRAPGAGEQPFDRRRPVRYAGRRGR